MQAKERLVIWGASGHATVVADIVRLQGAYDIVGFVDDVNKHNVGMEFSHSTILGGAEALPTIYKQGTKTLIVAVGDPFARLSLSERALGIGFRMVTAIHPAAVIAVDANVGLGSVVAAGAIIAPGAELGLSSLVNHLASVDHGCKVGDGATICPGVKLAGDVVVGRATWIGIGASVKERVRIGANVVVGAGAVVVKDIPDDCVAYGVPARIVRRREQRVD